jgi:hypothetical protein
MTVIVKAKTGENDPDESQTPNDDPDFFHDTIISIAKGKSPKKAFSRRKAIF